MRQQGQSNSLFDVDAYARSQEQVRRFKSQLPSDAVETLARETIRRLCERDEEISVETPSEDEIIPLCHALLDDDPLAGAAFISGVRSAGASIDAVYLKYLARAAQKLGEWWDDDVVPFSKVTLGTSRMYAIMRAMRHQMPITNGLGSKSAIFVSVPDETHTLGVRMATDLLRKDGWNIDLLVGEDHDNLVSHITQSDVPLVGISAGGQHSLHALSRLVMALGIKKPETKVFVSGQITQEAREAVALIGIDKVATDLDGARALMDDLWDELHG